VPHDHDLTFDISPELVPFGYTAYCFSCGCFFKDVEEPELVACRPVVDDPRQEMPR
jgi:hypothetical protein